MRSPQIKNPKMVMAGVLALVLTGLGTVPVNAGPEKKADQKATTPKLTGAELYSINCARCHQERYPTEFNSAQWETLMLHMRVRANLPAAQAREILKYLKENSRK